MKRTIKKILPRSLFGRSLLILITPIILIQLISTVVFFNRHWEKMTDRLAYAVAGEVALIINQIDTQSTLTPAKFKLLSDTANKKLGLVLSFEERKGNFRPNAVKTSRSVVARTLADKLEGQIDYPYTVHVDIPHKLVHVLVDIPSGILHITLPQRRLFSSSGYIFLLWMIGTSLALLAIAVLFMRNQIRPIRRLAVAAERIGKGRTIPASFKPAGAREVRQAGHAFIDMYDRIRRQIEQRTAMLAGVSHDLRTPLTRMKLQTAMLPDNEDSRALKSDIADMERMINAYLDFVRGEGNEKTSRINLAELLHRIADKTRRHGTNVKTELPEKGISLQARPVALERCFANIINNAGKFARNATIRLHKDENKDIIVIVFDDDGPGIPAEDYEDVFKPFVRGEPSRNVETGGVGLGLPIARDIVHSHGGEISLDKSPLGGLRVTVSLPV